jgi:putative membrane protein
VLLIAFSTAAMLTVLNRPPGPWMQEEPTATIMRVAWRFSGPLYVSLGALAMAMFLWGRLGIQRTMLLFLAGAGIALGVELAGTATGLPFGEYHYSPMLGYRILGRVPFPIPLSWFYMLVGCLTIVARRARTGAEAVTKWRWAVLAALALVAWDVVMDPAMVRTGHWTWGTGESLRNSALLSPVADFFTRDAFYGMPLSNWLGWFLTGAVIARVMLAVVPPAIFATRVADSRIPVIIYLANGVMPVALCLRDGLWWPAIIGAAVMLIPAILALRPRGAARVRPSPVAADLVATQTE